MSETPSLDLKSIEHDLKASWASASRTSALDGSISRACLSNVIIYTEDPSEEPRLREIVTQFIEKHPCRTIVVMANPESGESSIHAEVSNHIFETAGRRQVSCEQINLHVKGAGLHQLASAVQSLLVPDLPIYLWWRGVFLKHRHLFEQMITFVDKFIYDGVGWKNLHDTVPEVSEFIEKYRARVGFTNFNWSRLRPWREFAADFFDAGLYEREIWDLNFVRVEYMSLAGTEEGQQFRALLFVSWLAVQLEWQPVKGKAGQDEARIRFLSKNGEIVDAELALIPQTSDKGQSLQKITMGIRREANPVEFVIQRDHGDHLMTLQCTKNENCQILRRVPHFDSSEAELLFRELGRRTRNRVFEKSFKMASDLMQMI